MAFNTIKLHMLGKTYTLEDVDYISGSVQDVLNNSLIGTDLPIDELSFTIRARDARNTPNDWLESSDPFQLESSEGIPLEVSLLNYITTDFSEAHPYQDKVEIWRGNTLEGMYYVKSVERIGHGGGWSFVCVSPMGIIDRQEHAGGVYFNTPAGDIIAELMGDLTYSIEADVAATGMYGWLPYATSARDNLKQVLFAVGASVLMDGNGDPYITFELPSTVIAKTVREVYEGSSRDKIAAATAVQLTEHTFYASANVAPDVLYEAAPGTTVSNYKVIFDKPYHTLDASGLTINPDSSGANWAIISGSGSLTGIPYVHIQRIKELSTGVGGEAAIVAVKEATLISQMNSETAIERLRDYYSMTEEISAQVLTDARPGSLLRIPDPNNFSKTVSGYIKAASRVYSATIKSTLKLTRGWAPGSYGNAYDNYVIVTAEDLSGTTWTVPNELRGKRALVVLFGGAQGGQGGYDGDKGGDGTPASEDVVRRGTGGLGGLGGDGGEGGGPGKYLTVNIASLANSYSITIGAGGAGGARNGTAGAIGGDTVFGSYSTASGDLLDGAYVNMLDASTYGEQGPSGAAGADGGAGGDLPNSTKAGTAGSDGSNFNALWKGGKGGLGHRNNDSVSSGGGGGGAAYGSSAADCTQDPSSINYATAGANASAPAQAAFYMGGTGGNGGGGGGGSGYRWNGFGANFRDGGAGGLGSVGGQGADGFVLVYYKA